MIIKLANSGAHSFFKHGVSSSVRRLFMHSMLALTVIAPSPSALAAKQTSDTVEPEFSTASTQPMRSKSATGNRQMVVTANPHATHAGIEILRRGGTATDAMVAVQFVLGLVEPQSSGLGGGAFTLYHDALTKKLTAYDGRETAPLAANENLFISADQTPMQFFDAVVGGRSVGTPGTVKLLAHIHDEHGELLWKELLAPAIKLAKEGFEVSPRLANAIERDAQRLAINSNTADYFLPNGTPLKTGTMLKNPEYAAVLELLASKGASAFYAPEFAESIVEEVRAQDNPGRLAIEDFTKYQVVERDATCAPFLIYTVCGMGPPSSGAVSVGQILMLAEAAGIDQFPAESPKAWHLIAEATRLAFADRNHYLADPSFVDNPDWLLNPSYIKQRAAMIKHESVSGEIKFGTFTASKKDRANTVTGVQTEQASTTHFSIVDFEGNIVSSTSTIENGFGSRVMVNGFLLNNELTDFSFKPENESGLVANRVEPGKRPRSSMAPTIVYKDDNPILVIGSPGGSRIINYVANSLVRVLLWDQPIPEAIDAPHISNRYGPMDLENGAVPEALLKAFSAFGYSVNERDLNSGLHAIKIDGGVLRGAADRRREGTVQAD